MSKIQQIILSSVIKSYETKENIFELVIKKIQEFYDLPAHDMSELKKKESKQIKGLYFEELCKLYLKNSFTNVWLLDEVPDDILKKLKLKRRDYGIDIICENNGKFSAVQAKYRKIGRASKNIITWKMLSTFYALCLRTGPYEKYIVMTNADYVTHMGQKTPKDLSICIGTWKGLSTETWLKMAGTEKTETVKKEMKTIEEIRELRLKNLQIN